MSSSAINWVSNPLSVVCVTALEDTAPVPSRESGDFLSVGCESCPETSPRAAHGETLSTGLAAQTRSRCVCSVNL